jgi:serine/threonine protein kinase
VLIDFGLSYHNQLPDLLQEEFRLPYGTAPYMAPERLLGVRDDPRSDLFSLGVLLYFFTTGERPFGETETMRGMRRRLWRDPHPPRKLRPDYPPWLQEIVLRCLEIDPVWRHPTASQLTFDLAHPDQVKLTARSERLDRDPISTVLRRCFNRGLAQPKAGLPSRWCGRPGWRRCGSRTQQPAKSRTRSAPRSLHRAPAPPHCGSRKYWPCSFR